MLPRLFLLIILFTSCQRGLIPCPGVEPIKYKARYIHKPRPALLANAKEEPNEKITWKKPKEKFVEDVTIEEWDCPKPGKKKYMPKAVKQNIRKNERLVNALDSIHFTSDRKE